MSSCWLLLTALLAAPHMAAAKFRLIFDNYRGLVHDEVDLPAANTTEDPDSNAGLLPGMLTAEHCFRAPPGCPNENITFWFYTRATQDNPVQVSVADPASFSRMKVVPGAPWKFLIHGYTGWKDYSPNMEIRPAFFEHGEYNILCADYGPLVKEPCYIQGASNVPLVGHCTAQLIDALVGGGVFALEQLHVVAFSLGAQVASQIGQFLQSGRLERLTGLDPAWPLFMGPDLASKLDASDAKFVDVIHTNMGTKGQMVNCGHVDFYPNGGYSQQGCTADSEYGSVSSCNHARAPIYYAESIASTAGFWGVPCSSYIGYYWGWCGAAEDQLVIMGERTPHTARGSHYLTTNAEFPYARGKVEAEESSGTEGGDSRAAHRRPRSHRLP